MGFREGSGLGKDGLGISEPISIGLGNGRLGLGVMEEKRRAAQDALQMQKQQERSLRESFLDNRKKTFEVTKVLRDLEKAQKACEELDVACGIESSEFWARTTDDEEPQKPDNVIEVRYFFGRVYFLRSICIQNISVSLFLSKGRAENLLRRCRCNLC